MDVSFASIILTLTGLFLCSDAFIPAAILQAQQPTKNIQHGSSATATTPSSQTALFATKKKKISMAEKRKRRGRKLPPRKVERPAVLDKTAPIDAWDKVVTTDESVAQMQANEDSAAAKHAAADDEIQARAAKLIESQRKSVDTLTLIKERTEALDYDAIADGLQSKGYCVIDNFLDQSELIAEMEQEAIQMLQNDKLDRDVTNLESGEFVTAIQGGEAQYADVPRTVEYIVSLTRHMPPLLNEHNKAVERAKLDDTASTGSLRVFDRRARQSSLELLTEAPPPRDFELANEGNKNDLKAITVMYFLSPEDWDADMGGGVAFEADETVIEPCRDRLLVFRSDSCRYRMEPFSVDAAAGRDNCAHIVNHLLRKGGSDENQA